MAVQATEDDHGGNTRTPGDHDKSNRATGHSMPPPSKHNNQIIMTGHDKRQMTDDGVEAGGARHKEAFVFIVNQIMIKTISYFPPIEFLRTIY